MKTPTVREMKEKLEFMDMYDELSYIMTLEAELKRLRTQITKSAKAKCTIPVVSGSTSNLENVLGMLHEFRNWNREWDIYFAKYPKNVDEFAKLLSKRYKVERV